MGDIDSDGVTIKVSYEVSLSKKVWDRYEPLIRMSIRDNIENGLKNDILGYREFLKKDSLPRL